MNNIIAVKVVLNGRWRRRANAYLEILSIRVTSEGRRTSLASTRIEPEPFVHKVSTQIWAFITSWKSSYSGSGHLTSLVFKAAKGSLPTPG